MECYEFVKVCVCVIVNVVLGCKVGFVIVQWLCDWLELQVVDFQICVFGKGDDLVVIVCGVVVDGFDLLVVVGGDGMQVVVVSVVIGMDVVMVVIFGGMFNYFVCDFGLGEIVDEVMKIFDVLYLCCIYVGEMNGMIFLNNCSFGVYFEILKCCESIYKCWGWLWVVVYWLVVVVLWILCKFL